MARLPAIPRPGEPVRAETLAQVIEFLHQVTRVRAGPGIDARFAADGLHLSLPWSPEPRHRARVVRTLVDGQPWNGVDPPLPGQVTYDVRTIDRQYEALGITPNLGGRPVANDEVRIWPAPPGAPCFIDRFPRADGTLEPALFVWEQVAFGPCEPPERARPASAEDPPIIPAGRPSLQFSLPGGGGPPATE